ncbi:hypothetical protein [Primorskyibacter sedentarius]
MQLKVSRVQFGCARATAKRFVLKDTRVAAYKWPCKADQGSMAREEE